MVIIAFNLLLAVCVLVGFITGQDRRHTPGAVKLVLLAVFVFLHVTVLKALP